MWCGEDVWMSKSTLSTQRRVKPPPKPILGTAKLAEKSNFSATCENHTCLDEFQTGKDFGNFFSCQTAEFFNYLRDLKPLTIKAQYLHGGEGGRRIPTPNRFLGATQIVRAKSLIFVKWRVQVWWNLFSKKLRLWQILMGCLNIISS